MKKILALVLALVMVLMVGAAFADGGISLVDTNAGAATHEYKVYQVFVGNLSGDQLTDVKYGVNYGDAGASVPVTELQAITDARAFATSIISNLHGSPVATLKNTNNFAATGLDNGYYLIIDDTEKSLVDGDAYSKYIVQVLGSVTNFAVKKSTTTFDKTITADDHTEETSSPNPGISGDGKIDNVSIGDTVTYTLTGTIPAAATDYDSYFWYISDLLSSGLTFDKDTANITVTVNTDPVSTLVEDTDYKFYGAGEGYTFQIALLNPKAFAGKTVTVTYKATLNESAVINDPNNNTAKVIYANNPEYTYNGKIENGKPKEIVPTGETPDSITRTYTTGIKIRKVDQDLLPLKGASFTLSGDSINKVVKNIEVFEEDSTGPYWKLKTGSYTTQAPITEDITNGDGTVTKKNSELYLSTTTKYKKTTTTSVENTTEHVTQTLTVNDDGTLEFKGLGAGVYTIKEINAPQGYNKAADITVTIAFDNSTKQFTATGYSKDSDGFFSVQVVNNAGTELPSTGGIGTTIFYVLGGLLVIGAAVVLVARRKAHD
jgi:fimbrial isopeptide formation D2 family protein/LPXTG-motif cell wall-anchored protein